MSDKLLAEWFWADRWMGSSAFLLPLEPRGLYREMLTQAWRRGASLPSNPQAIQRAVGCTAEEWDRCWPQIRAYWIYDGDGSIFNETQRKVYAEAVSRVEARRTRAQKAAQVRWDARAHAQALPGHMLEQCPPSPSPSPSPEPTQEGGGATRPARKRAPAFREEEALSLRPESVPEEAWSRFIEHNWRRKKPTRGAVEGWAKKLARLAEGRSPEAAEDFIDECVDANAQGIAAWAYKKALEAVDPAPRGGNVVPMGWDAETYRRRKGVLEINKNDAWLIADQLREYGITHEQGEEIAGCELAREEEA